MTTQDSTQGGSATSQYFMQVVCCSMCGYSSLEVAVSEMHGAAFLPVSSLRQLVDERVRRQVTHVYCTLVAAPSLHFA